MRILQLCFINNLWPPEHVVVSIDIKTGNNVLDLPFNFGNSFDCIVAAPPCEQFTKANSLNWLKYPDYFIYVAKHCFNICTSSGKPWVLENPPGRITSFIPELLKYRICTWHGSFTNKEYIVYSNQLLLLHTVKRYGKAGSVSNFSKVKKEAWQPDFHDFIQRNILLK